MVKTHILLNGNCIEAINFYKEVFRANIISLIQKKDIKELNCEDSVKEHVINCEIEIHGHHFVFCDFVEGLEIGNNISLMVELETKDLIKEYYENFKNNGTLTINMQETPFSKLCFAIEDKFHINWIFMLKPNSK